MGFEGKQHLIAKNLRAKHQAMQTQQTGNHRLRGQLQGCAADFSEASKGPSGRFCLSEKGEKKTPRQLDSCHMFYNHEDDIR